MGRRLVARWRHLREPGWRRGLSVNAAGGVATAVVLVITTYSKFGGDDPKRFGLGAWIICLLVPLLVMIFPRPAAHQLPRHAGAVRLQRDVMVFIPELVASRWWHGVLHNQNALRLKAALLFRTGIVVVNVPYHLSTSTINSGLSVVPVASDAHSVVLDSSKARRTPGWQPKYDVERLVAEAWDFERPRDEPRIVVYPG